MALVRTVISIINKYNLEACPLNVKTAFLNEEIDEEIYMEIPEGSAHSTEIKREMVCKLSRALYCLRISPKRWNEKFTKIALSVRLNNTDMEPCLFTWRDGEKFLLLLLYVDDILLASNEKTKMEEVKIKLSKEFEMTIIGEPKEFLNITIRRDRENRTIKLNQEKYINKILRKFGYENAFPHRTPMITTQASNHERRERESEVDGELLSKDEKKISCPYREVVGSLLYLAGTTRPDILYAVNVLSRHQINPTAEDWKMASRVLRYLRGTMLIGLKYTGEKDEIDSYSDASFADCKGSLTTCGFIIKLFGDTIMWRTRKQSYVALSTCQAEYVAMSEASQELLSIYNSLKLILINIPLPMVLYCDNRAANISVETDGGNRLRHIVDVKAHHIKECIKMRLIKVNWVSSRDQLADVLTKPLAFELHKRQVDPIMNCNI